MPQGECTPTREWFVDGRRVLVFDGLLENPGAYVEALDRAAFTRTEVARPETAKYRHWVTEIRLDALARQPLLGLTLGAMASASLGLELRPYRAYTNAATYGDMLFSHADSAEGSGELTALWFMCSDDDIDLGGETVFYDNDGEIACAVRPKPGRLVLFDGTIVHAGRPPSRISFETRFTLAIKFERVAGHSGIG